MNTLKKHLQLLPLFLLTVYCTDTVITAIRGSIVMAGVSYDFTLTIKHYIAFGGIGVNLLIFFFLRSFYKYSLGLTILLGLSNLMTFSALETTWSVGLNSLKISFQPAALWAGLLAYMINFKRVNRFVIETLKAAQTPEELEKNEKERFEHGVEKFKEKYSGYSIETLTEILTAKRYVPEALEAAKQLLFENQSSEKTILTDQETGTTAINRKYSEK